MTLTAVWLTWVFVAFPDPAGHDPRRDEQNLAHLREGMPASAVVDLFGRPQRVSRQFLYACHLEQWLYPRVKLRVEFRCEPGREAIVRRFWIGRPTTP